METTGQEEHRGQQSHLPQLRAHLALLRHQRRRGESVGRGDPQPPHLRWCQPQAADQAVPGLWRRLQHRLVRSPE